MNAHPNATTAAGTGGLATLLLYLAELKGWHVDPLVASGVATAAAAVVLFIGRRGIKGLFESIWRGNPKP